MASDSALERLAEAPLALTDPDSSVIKRFQEPRFWLVHSQLAPDPLFGCVTGIRLTDVDVPSAVRDAREWFAGTGRQRFSWWVRESKNPPGLVKDLSVLGLSPFDGEPEGYAMMVLRTAPPTGGVRVHMAETPADHVRAAAILADAFMLSDEARVALMRSALRRRSIGTVTFLAEIDGRAVARGSLALARDGSGALFGGATLPEYRGRGCYKALVDARWRVMRNCGGRGLVVNAGAQSRPILEELGFDLVDRLTVLLDRSSRL